MRGKASRFFFQNKLRYSVKIVNLRQWKIIHNRYSELDMPNYIPVASWDSSVRSVIASWVNYIHSLLLSNSTYCFLPYNTLNKMLNIPVTWIQRRLSCTSNTSFKHTTLIYLNTLNVNTSLEIHIFKNLILKTTLNLFDYLKLIGLL